MAFWPYWWKVWRRAGRESWRAMVKHTWMDLIRNALVLLATVGIAVALSPVLVGNQLMSADNTQDTVVWTVLVLAAISALLVVVFFAHLIFLTPYNMWKELDAQAKERSSVVIQTDARAVRVSRQKTFPLWEAACLLAGTEIVKEPVGEASAYLYRLKAMISDGHIKVVEYGGGILPSTFFYAVAGISTREARIEAIGSGFELDRANFKRAAKRLEIDVAGL
jgi:hypothetical protein